MFAIPQNELLFDPGFRMDPRTCRMASSGSCFSERFPELMTTSGVLCCSNPCGIVYNPVSLAESIVHSTEDIPWRKEELFPFAGLWHSWHHHGSFSSPDPEETLAKAEGARLRFRDFLKQADLLLLTPATAVVFRLKTNGMVTANCHKVPGTEFERGLLSFVESLQAFRTCFGSVKKFNPSCRIVAGVSPVRHHPGDVILNSRSKSVVHASLRQAIEESDNAVYFPGFELMNDVLRDYRFYRDDLCHPTETAEHFILSRLASGLFGEAGETCLDEAYRIEHRSVHRTMREEQ